MATVLALAATSLGAPQGNSDLNERDLVAIVVSSNNNHQGCDTESCDSFCQDNHLKGGDCDDDGNCICDWNFAERVLGTPFGKVPESAHDHGHRQAENFCFSPVCNAECQKNQNMNGYCDDGECVCFTEPTSHVLASPFRMLEQLAHGRGRVRGHAEQHVAQECDNYGE
ncbi:hypothetical protein EG328_006620 [Venturia inaequalis]|uniref:Uncharacterized protein n=1 Tax=Venturia inaequalis TaxID=5025 RepID=A0A8H3UGQ8_VENIN|nr:hypothetical protein EG328_006620 [Venturia inaequalis]